MPSEIKQRGQTEEKRGSGRRVEGRTINSEEKGRGVARKRKGQEKQ